MAGEPPVPTRAIESALLARLRAALPEGAPVRVRVIRREGDRAIAEVEHRQADSARSAWNGKIPVPGGSFEATTHRTWGTLRGAKIWLRATRTGRVAPAR